MQDDSERTLSAFGHEDLPRAVALSENGFIIRDKADRWIDQNLNAR